MTNIDILKSKYNLTSENEELAKKVFDILESHSKTPLYESNDKGQITGFYSKVMVNRILENFKVITFGGKEYFYEDGYYKHNDSIQKFIYSKLHIQDKSRVRNIKESLNDLRINTNMDADLTNSDDNIINFKNGLFNIKENKLYPHNEKVLSTIQINGKYNKYEKGIENTLFWKFLNTSFNVEMILLLQEIIGYCLSSKTQAEKMFVLHGKGSNGKSVFLSILNSLYNHDFVSSVELKDLSKHEFVARLYNKALNICADLSSEYISNTGLIKQLFGIDYIEARPLYSNPFSFRNKAKMLFSANDLPATGDKSYGWFRRLIIINCNKEIKESDKIEDLNKKIIENELDIIISWAIEGLQRLIKNKYKFSENSETIQSLEDYKLNTNTIKQFVNEFCCIGNGGNIGKTEFMEMYKRFCKTENVKALGSRHLNSTMKDLHVKEIKREIRYWNDISWLSHAKELSSIYPEYELNGDFNKILDITEKQYKKDERKAIQEESELPIY